jgi:hypothetical protein
MCDPRLGLCVPLTICFNTWCLLGFRYVYSIRIVSYPNTHTHTHTHTRVLNHLGVLSPLVPQLTSTICTLRVYVRVCVRVYVRV